MDIILKFQLKKMENSYFTSYVIQIEIDRVSKLNLCMSTKSMHFPNLYSVFVSVSVTKLNIHYHSDEAYIFCFICF